MKRWALVAVCGFVALVGCSSSSSAKAANGQPATTVAAAPATTTSSAPATPDTQVWLCKPGLAHNPCLTSLDATAIGPDGTKTVTNTAAAADPKIDCFYVYPTVSEQPTPSATLAIDPAEVGVAVAEAARYSHTCRMYAPIYRQGTIAWMTKSDADFGTNAVQSVLSAWKDYLARYNDGRGIVLIGHSQGSFVLERLISKYVEPDAAVRARVVSVILLGGDVMVPAGKDVGGTFKDLTACRSASQIGCVIAYSSFDHTPPSDSLFGRAPAGSQVLCTNPAALAGGSGPIDPYFPTKRMNSVISFATQPGVATKWVNYPDLFAAQCESDGGVTRLQITDTRKPGDDRPKLVDALGPTWGLHLYDANIALGNLVGIVRSEAAAYAANG